MRVHILFFGHHLTVSEVREARLDHYVVLEIENTLKIAKRHVQHQANAGWQRLKKPDMCYWGCQFDMAHALTADFLKGNFNTTFLADNAAILHALIFTAEAFVIFDWSKDTRTEQAVALWLEGTVVDGFWLFDFAKRPRQDALRGRERDFDLVERLDGGNRVKRVVCQFLVHFQILERGALEEEWPPIFLEKSET